MKHKFLLSIIIIAVAALALIYWQTGNKQNALFADMVALDRSYIPALAYTSQGKLDAARSSMQRLIGQWEDFKSRNLEMQNKDPLWDEDMDRVETRIQAARRILQQGGDTLPAHEELEHIRDVMLEVRERNNIDYFIDYLTRFHESMETIVLSVKDKEAEMISGEDIQRLRAETEDAYQLWQDVLDARFDARVFGFDEKHQARLAQLKAQERDALETLRQALQGDDKQAIRSAALAIKPIFAKLFMLFGDFSPAH